MLQSFSQIVASLLERTSEEDIMDSLTIAYRIETAKRFYDIAEKVVDKMRKKHPPEFAEYLDMKNVTPKTKQLGQLKELPSDKDGNHIKTKKRKRKADDSKQSDDSKATDVSSFLDTRLSGQPADDFDNRSETKV